VIKNPIKMNHSGYIYIMTNKNRTTLYIGVTNDLCRRIYEHKNHLIKGSFTDKYNLEYCIYYEEFPYFDLAIKREKELKKWNRQKKENLINKKNPEWKVLVTEKGFVRNTVPFSHQVSELLTELQQNDEIPPFSRNDSAQSMNDEIPPCGRNDSAQCMNNEIPPCGQNDSAQCMNDEIPPCGRNDSAQCMNDEIPPFSRNDSSPCGLMGEAGGGEAATCFTTLKEPSVIPNETKCSEESSFSCQPPVIPSEARNPNNETPVIPSEARNLSTCDNGVIPNETNNQKFNNTTKET
jgi:putative endonuclease